LESLTDSQNAE